MSASEQTGELPSDMTDYEIKYAGKGRAPNRDASEVRLRLECDGRYHQYFVALASGVRLRLLEPLPGEEFWKRFVELASQEVERWIASGGTPEPDPTDAVLLTPDVNKAHTASRSGNSTLPMLPRDDDPLEGIVVHRFSIP